MARIQIKDLSKYLAGLTSKVETANIRALARLGMAGEQRAKSNIRKTFGYAGKTRTNNLMNSIFWDLRSTGRKLVAVIGSRGVIYARLQEYGYKDLKPVHARFLWIGLRDQWRKGSKFAKMTPREFVTAKEKEPGKYFFFKRGEPFSRYADMAIAGARTSDRKDGLRRLWQIRSSVTIPARPYLLPAVREIAGNYPQYFNEEFSKVMLTRRGF